MTTSSQTFKHLLFDIISYTDELDDNLNRLPRTGWPKAIAPSCSSLKRKLTDDVIVSDVNGEDWYSKTDDKPEGFVQARQRFSENPVELTAKEVEAVKTLYGTLTEVADYGPEAFDLLDELLSK